MLEARAEVGVLTRNIKYRGSDNPSWHEEIEACPDGFDTGTISNVISFVVSLKPQIFP